MEDVDSSMTIMDNGDIIDVKNNLFGVYLANAIETAKDEDISGDVITGDVTHRTSVTINTWLDFADGADLTESRSVEIDFTVDVSAEDENDCESDSDSTSESTFLEAMTPDGQDYYLRLGDTPRQRSALRLSRIIARRQLLQRLEQGRNRANYGKAIVCP